MAKFRLVKGAGPHKQAGKVYRAGDEVENEADLVKIFPGKFELVSGTPGGDEDERQERPVETHTPYDNAATRRAAPPGNFQSEEEEVPEDEEPVTRPSDAPEGGESNDEDEETAKPSKSKAQEKKKADAAKAKSSTRTTRRH